MEFMDIKGEVIPKRKNTSNKIGAKFEQEIKDVFKDYFHSGDAYITKIPTEATVIRKFGKITNVVYRENSDSLDFQGVLKDGRFITFETKTYNAYDEKRNSNKPFPLDNIDEYQFELAETLANYTNKIFYIIQARLKDENEHYMMHWSKVKEFKDSSGRKSIPYDKLSEIGIKMEDLDILKYIDRI